MNFLENIITTVAKTSSVSVTGPTSSPTISSAAAYRLATYWNVQSLRNSSADRCRTSLPPFYEQWFQRSVLEGDKPGQGARQLGSPTELSLLKQTEYKKKEKRKLVILIGIY